MPALPKRGHGLPGLGIEGDHLVAGRDVDDAFFLTVGPVREPTSGEPPRRRFAALALVQAVHPFHLAGRGIEGDDGAPRAAVE